MNMFANEIFQGDSGGGLFLAGTNTQVGIVSYGNGCARPSAYIFQSFNCCRYFNTNFEFQ